MSTTLCFDFGNTRRKVAIFKNADIKEVIVLQDDSNATIESLVKEWKAGGTAHVGFEVRQHPALIAGISLGW